VKISKTHRKLKIALWTVGAVVILMLFSIVSLTVMAHRAVSDYRGDATAQLNDVIAGKTTGMPVELNSVLFGEILNGDYKRIKTLDEDYKKLLVDTKSYVAVLDVHNTLVEQYNTGIKGETPLNSDLLKSVNKLRAVMENRFPDEKNMAKTISDLAIKITSNTDFDVVSVDIDTVLQSSDRFLSELREKLNTRSTEFQQKVN